MLGWTNSSVHITCVIIKLMKRLLLLKQTNSPVTAHLYEHMTMNALKRLACKADLFKQIDYFFLGTNYTKTGLITIDIDLYTDESTRLEKSLQNIKTPITEETIQLAMQQIAAETEQIIVCDDATKLKHSLNTLNDKAWQSLETADTINTTNHLFKNENIKQVDEPALTVDHITYALTGTLPDDDTLKPLFYYLTSAIHSTVADIANHQLGYYETSRSFSCHGNRAMCTNEFAAMRHLINNVELERSYHNIIEKIIKPANLSRIIGRLKSFSYTNGTLDTPNIDLFEKNVGVIIGPKIWQNLADEGLITRLLTNFKLEQI